MRRASRAGVAQPRYLGRMPLPTVPSSLGLVASINGAPWEPIDDVGRAALDELALDVVEMHTDTRRGPTGATLDDVCVSLGPYESTMRKDDTKRVVVWTGRDIKESHDEVAAALGRLVQAGHVVRQGERHYITPRGRKHLRALQAS
jgi:hypothetical protein